LTRHIGIDFKISLKFIAEKSGESRQKLFGTKQKHYKAW